MGSLLIKNGLVVTEDAETICDILCEGEKITQIGINLYKGEATEVDEVIDATGKIVIPGGVDVHTHLNIDTGTALSCDDFYSGTVAAAFGGTTTIVDHPGFGPAGCALDHQIKKYHGLANGRAVVDYGFHGVLQHVDDDVLAMMETLAGEGITSFKAYLTYGFKLSDADMFKILRRAKEIGVLIAVHCENDGLINLLRDECKSTGNLSPEFHPRSRPPESEAEAINRMILFANTAKLRVSPCPQWLNSYNAPLYIVHVSTALGLEFIEAAKRRGQKNLWAETCPQYLFLDESLYSQSGNESLKYIMCPPLRTSDNQAALWQGLQSSNTPGIDVVATDHCPFIFETQKILGKDDFTKTPSGISGIEERLPLMYSEGVTKGRITLRRFTDLCCTNPAKIFGLYPRKGILAHGSDADITIIDPEKQTILSHKDLHSNADYSAYEGYMVQGWPVCTISRGEIIVDNGKFTGVPGRGKFLKREKWGVGSREWGVGNEDCDSKYRQLT
jgi:dihydropyrimidinase